MGKVIAINGSPRKTCQEGKGRGAKYFPAEMERMELKKFDIYV